MQPPIQPGRDEPPSQPQPQVIITRPATSAANTFGWVVIVLMTAFCGLPLLALIGLACVGVLAPEPTPVSP